MTSGSSRYTRRLGSCTVRPSSSTIFRTDRLLAPSTWPRQHVALLLNNLIFRLGVHRRADLTIDPSTVDPKAITDFIERNAAMWRARRDVVNRLQFGITHLVDTVIHFYHVSRMICFAVSYDEFDVEATLAYAGRPFLVPETRPTLDEIADTDNGHLRFTGYVRLQSADTVRVTEESGETLVRLDYL